MSIFGLPHYQVFQDIFKKLQDRVQQQQQAQQHQQQQQQQQQQHQKLLWKQFVNFQSRRTVRIIHKRPVQPDPVQSRDQYYKNIYLPKLTALPYPTNSRDAGVYLGTQ